MRSPKSMPSATCKSLIGLEPASLHATLAAAGVPEKFDGDGLGHAAHLAAGISIRHPGVRLALPAAFGFFRKQIEPPRDIGARRSAALTSVVRQDVRDRARRRWPPVPSRKSRIVAREACPALSARHAPVRCRRRAKSAAVIVSPVESVTAHRVLDAFLDQIGFEFALVLQIALGFARAVPPYKAAAGRYRDGRDQSIPRPSGGRRRSATGY